MIHTSKTPINILGHSLSGHSLKGGDNGQVISERSSFGRLAALRSLRFRSVFTVRSAASLAERGRNISAWECTRDQFDSFEDVAVRNSWVKI